MNHYDFKYTTLTGRHCRADVAANTATEATDAALAGLAREGIKVLTHDGASVAPEGKSFNIAPTLLRLDY